MVCGRGPSIGREIKEAGKRIDDELFDDVLGGTPLGKDYDSTNLEDQLKVAAAIFAAPYAASAAATAGSAAMGGLQTIGSGLAGLMPGGGYGAGGMGPAQLTLGDRVMMGLKGMGGMFGGQGGGFDIGGLLGGGQQGGFNLGGLLGGGQGGFNVGDLVSGLGQAYATDQQVSAEKEAAQLQYQAAQDAAQLQRDALASYERRTDPFREMGVSTITPLAQAVQRGSNPLFDALEQDVTRRVFANQAARGKLGSGETPGNLATALAPMRLEQQQRDISNLFDVTRLGANIATGQGTAGMTSAGNVGQALGAGAGALAQGRLGRADAIGSGLGELALLMGSRSSNPFGGMPFNPTARY